MKGYLSIWNACNIKCKFCYNDLAKSNNIFFESIEDSLFKIKEIKKNYNKIIIVWGEPFFYPYILDCLKYIKKMNFNKVLIVTNWIKLSDLKYAILLYKYWVNSLEFSIHANNKKMDEQISWKSWKNFIKREVWIKNILLLNNKFDNKISLYSNTVINSINYENIINIIEYINNLWIKNISISFMYNVKWLSKENIKLLVKYSDVINVLNNSNNNFKSINLKINWLPYCLHKKITNVYYKIRKENVSKKTDTKNNYLIKLEECSKCQVYWKLCNWVFSDYLYLFWNSEFKSL
jgi:MoaA/NifB/PqqE/SkfB family radical SAM enzyme